MVAALFEVFTLLLMLLLLLRGRTRIANCGQSKGVITGAPPTKRPSSSTASSASLALLVRTVGGTLWPLLTTDVSAGTPPPSSFFGGLVRYGRKKLCLTVQSARRWLCDPPPSPCFPPEPIIPTPAGKRSAHARSLEANCKTGAKGARPRGRRAAIRPAFAAAAAL